VEWVVVGSLVVATLVLGVLPQVLLSVTGDAVTALMGGGS
jgi:NADH-quinone oxidoreductase subunit M